MAFQETNVALDNRDLVNLIGLVDGVIAGNEFVLSLADEPTELLIAEVAVTMWRNTRSRLEDALSKLEEAA